MIVTYFVGFRVRFQLLRRRNPQDQFLRDRAILARFLKQNLCSTCLGGFSPKEQGKTSVIDLNKV